MCSTETALGRAKKKRYKVDPLFFCYTMAVFDDVTLFLMAWLTIVASVIIATMALIQVIFGSTIVVIFAAIIAFSVICTTLLSFVLKN